MLTQLLGPNRHTAHEQQEPGANWKTRQREGLCPGKALNCSTSHRSALQEVCCTNTGHLGSQAGIISTLLPVCTWLCLSALSPTDPGKGQSSDVCMWQRCRGAGLSGCGACAAQQQFPHLPAPACHCGQAQPQRPSAAAGCCAGRHTAHGASQCR